MKTSCVNNHIENLMQTFKRLMYTTGDKSK